MRRILGSFLLLVAFAAALPACSMVSIPQIWAKQPGSKSKLFAFEKNGKVGFIDPMGRVVIRPRIPGSTYQVGDFVDGLCRIQSRTERDGEEVEENGYINKRGEWVIRLGEATPSDFCDGMAQVFDVRRRLEKGYKYFLRPDGSKVEPIRADWFYDFSEGLAAFRAEARKGIRDLRPGSFKYLDYPGLKGFLDKAGQVAIPATFADVGPFRGGLARAVLDGFCHVAYPSGARDGSPTTGDTSSCGGAPPEAVEPCKTGFIGRDGNFVLPAIYESALDFSEGLAGARVNGNWGFIDRQASMVIKPEYDEVDSFHGGMAAFREGPLWGFLDRSGKVRIKARYKEVKPFSEGLAAVRLDEEWAYVDPTGRTAIRGSFREATPFVHGIAAVRVSETRVLYIDKAGRLVFEYSLPASRRGE
jgi:hypothetical protein